VENLYVFKGYGAKKLCKEFLNKDWGLQGLNKLFKKLRETGTTIRRQHWKHRLQNCSCFSIL